MKLATWNDGTRDGQLVVVSRDGSRCVPAAGIAHCLQDALDRWEDTEPRLRELERRLDAEQLPDERPVNPSLLMAPLPRAYEWIDGSAYINHIVLVRKARGAELPKTLETEPLVYQGASGHLLGPTAPIAHFDDAWGIDFESEVCVLLGDVPMGTRAKDLDRHVRLVTICNDVTLRNLIPAELEKGFGFFVSKPATAFAPFAVTPDELGEAWKDGRVHLPLVTRWNGKQFGNPEAGPEMHFSFGDLLEHVTKTRRLTAGTILGSGTVSNRDPARGASCIAEQRMREKIEQGEMKTPFMKFGDTVEIEMLDRSGRNVFGTISQHVVRAERPE